MSRPFRLFIPLLLILLLLGLLACEVSIRDDNDPDGPATTSSVEFEHMNLDLFPDGIFRLDFHAPQEFSAGDNPLHFVVKDLNDDGYPDIVLLNADIDEELQAIRIYMHKPYAEDFPDLAESEDLPEVGASDPSQLYLDPVFVTFENDLPQFVLVEDFNGDGIQDLMVLFSADDAMVLFAGDASNNTLLTPDEMLNMKFEFVETFEAGDYPTFMVAADFEPTSATVSVDEAARALNDLHVNDLKLISQVETASTSLDVVMVNRADDSVSVAFQDGNGNFPLSTPTASQTYEEHDYIEYDDNEGVTEQPLQVVTGEFYSQDDETQTYPDFGVLVSDRTRIEVMGNVPRATIKNGTTLSQTRRDFTKVAALDVGESPQAIIAGDWDGDGLQDFMVTNREDRDYTLWYQLTAEESASREDEPLFERWDQRVRHGPGQAAAHDFNGDSVIDFVIGNIFDGDLYVVMSNGDWDDAKPGRPSDFHTPYTSKEIASGSVPSGNRPFFITVADVNGDDKADILTTITFESKLSFLIQQ